jgi:hypothetical protein
MSTIFPGSASVGQVFDGYSFNGTAWDIIGNEFNPTYFSPTAPDNPKSGDLWVDSSSDVPSISPETILTTSSASTTYLTQNAASTTYAPILGAYRQKGSPTYLTSGSGTYTVTVGSRAIRVRMVGGGGAGGGTTGVAAGCGGGGAGGYVESFIVSPSATYSYSIGSAGIGSTTTGGTGGNTTFGSFTASGGLGGVNSVGAGGGAGGAASGGNLNIPGSHGYPGSRSANPAGQYLSGGGASSMLGPGAAWGVYTTSSANGSAPAGGYGGGGSGAQTNGTSGFTGGNGASGIIIIEEYV